MSTQNYAATWTDRLRVPDLPGLLASILQDTQGAQPTVSILGGTGTGGRGSSIGSGTPNNLAKWVSASTLGNAGPVDNGVSVQFPGSYILRLANNDQLAWIDNAGNLDKASINLNAVNNLAIAGQQGNPIQLLDGPGGTVYVAFQNGAPAYMIFPTGYTGTQPCIRFQGNTSNISPGGNDFAVDIDQGAGIFWRNAASTVKVGGAIRVHTDGFMYLSGQATAGVVVENGPKSGNKLLTLTPNLTQSTNPIQTAAIGTSGFRGFFFATSPAEFLVGKAAPLNQLNSITVQINPNVNSGNSDPTSITNLGYGSRFKVLGVIPSLSFNDELQMTFNGDLNQNYAYRAQAINPQPNEIISYLNLNSSGILLDPTFNSSERTLELHVDTLPGQTIVHGRVNNANGSGVSSLSSIPISWNLVAKYVGVNAVTSITFSTQSGATMLGSGTNGTQFYVYAYRNQVM